MYLDGATTARNGEYLRRRYVIGYNTVLHREYRGLEVAVRQVNASSKRRGVGCDLRVSNRHVAIVD